MLILALDSASLSGSVSLCEDDRLIASFTVNTGNTHSETLLPMVEQVMKVSGRDVSEVDLFACTVGPGSFTGVRIGAATIKGLAFGQGKPCIGVSTPAALAEACPMRDGIICPVMNARRGQVYNALFSYDGEKPVRLCADRALPITELAAALNEPEYAAKSVYLVGDGAKMTFDAMTGAGLLPADRLICLPEHLRWPDGYCVAQAARRLYEAGVRTTDAELAPVYLRMSQAERTKLEKEGM